MKALMRLADQLASGSAASPALMPGRGRSSHFHAALFILYGESLIKYTGVHESDFAGSPALVPSLKASAKPACALAIT
jgi:hypothetical protein